MNIDNAQTILTESTAPNESEMLAETHSLFDPLLLLLIATYLIAVLKIGPSFMKSRSAYKLKTFIIIYNIYQILACIYLCALVYLIDIPTFQFWECSRFEAGTKVETDFNHIASSVFLIKVSELVETIVFILRKKQKQVSFLHVFHHASMVFLAFNYAEVYRTGLAIFPIFLNSSVHIIMYTYYLMAAVLPSNIVAKLNPLKKSITIIQMVQFTIVLLQVIVAQIYGCINSKMLVMAYVLIVCVIYYGFYDFYKKSYMTDKNNKKTKP